MKTKEELRELFRDSLYSVSGYLKTNVANISRDCYYQVCREQGYKYVNPYILGGYTNVRAELIDEGAFEGSEFSGNNGTDPREAMKEKLYHYVKTRGYVPNCKEFRASTTYIPTKVFGSMTELYDETRKKYKDIDEFVFNETFYTDAYKKELIKDLGKYNKYIITSAVCGKEVDENFFNSLKTYAKKNKALVLVIPIVKKNKSALYEWNLDPRLKEFKVVFEPIKLNDNLLVWDVRTKAEQFSALASIDKALTSLDSSIIIAGTKQSIKYVPTIKSKTPHMLATTGCCTVNDYAMDGYMPTKSTRLAEVTHKIGGLCIEVENDKIYHCRNIEAGPSGEFIDLSKVYKPDGKVEDVKNTVMIVGDLHVPKHNVGLVEKHLKLISKFNVSTVVLHDTVNMGSVTHHNKDKVTLRAAMALRGENTIMSEALALKEVLENFCKRVDNVVIPYSNHPDHLNRYLEEARFVEDNANFYDSLDLAKAMMDGKNVLQYLMEEKVGLKARNIEWLDKGDTASIFGVEVGLHGHQKANAGFASPLSFSKAVGKVVIAHKHSPSIELNAYVIGIACDPNQGYNEGSLSSWRYTSALLYPNGTVQLINFINVDDEYKCGI